MKSSLPNPLRSAFEQLDAGYDADQIEGALAGVHRRLARRRQARAVALGVCSFVVVVGVGWMVSTLRHRAAGDGASLVLSDGSRCTPHDAMSKVALVEDQPQTNRVQLRQGGAHFEVTPRPQRSFIVDAGNVEVRVLGTVFDVRRIALPGRGEAVNVSVQRGRVEVRAQQATGWTTLATLTAAQSVALRVAPNGLVESEPAAPPADDVQSMALAPSADATEPDSAVNEPEGRDTRDAARAARPRRAAPSRQQQHDIFAGTGGTQTKSSAADRGDGWRNLARQARYDEAYRKLKADTETPPSENDATDLFLAADSARLSGHAADAVKYLEELLRLHPSNERVALAAFTLGRLYLDELHQPRPAARAFSQARQLGAAPTLAEDALAREAEAWTAAHERERARRLASEYLKAYPQGQRVESMRRIVEGP